MNMRQMSSQPLLFLLHTIEFKVCHAEKVWAEASITRQQRRLERM